MRGVTDDEDAAITPFWQLGSGPGWIDRVDFDAVDNVSDDRIFPAAMSFLQLVPDALEVDGFIAWDVSGLIAGLGGPN